MNAATSLKELRTVRNKKTPLEIVTIELPKRILKKLPERVTLK